MDVYMCRKDDPLDDLKAVHAEFIKGKNLAIHRRDDQWWAANGDPFKDRVYKYVFCGGGWPATAYVIFTPKKTEGQDGYLADVQRSGLSYAGRLASNFRLFLSFACPVSRRSAGIARRCACFGDDY